MSFDALDADRLPAQTDAACQIARRFLLDGVAYVQQLDPPLQAAALSSFAHAASMAYAVDELAKPLHRASFAVVGTLAALRDELGSDVLPGVDAALQAMARSFDATCDAALNELRATLRACPRP